jgi:hypothetical protein
MLIKLPKRVRDYWLNQNEKVSGAKWQNKWRMKLNPLTPMKLNIQHLHRGCSNTHPEDINDRVNTKLLRC